MLYKSCSFHHQPFDFPRMTLLTQREQKIAFLRRSSSDYSRSTSQITSDNLGKHDDNADLYLYFSVPNDDNVRSARKLNQMFDLWVVSGFAEAIRAIPASNGFDGWS